MIPETPPTVAQNGDLLVETRGLQAIRSQITAVTDLDHGVRRGEVYGF
jgi:hypothetical protein